MLILPVTERGLVHLYSGLDFTLRNAMVDMLSPFSLYFRCVDCVLCTAGIRYRTVGLVLAVTKFNMSVHRVQEDVVVLFDDTAHAWHAGIAQFNCILVEDFAVAVTGGEVFPHQFQELLSNICSYTCIVRRIEPDYFAVAVPARCPVWFILQLRCMATVR